MELLSATGCISDVLNEVFQYYFKSPIKCLCAVVLVLCNIKVTYFGAVGRYWNLFFDYPL